MDVADALVANNEEYAARLDRDPLPPAPSLGLAIVTCMDCRLDPFAALGIGDGEAHIMRNAGGIVTDDVIRSLAISQRKLGTTEIVLIHHTKCGMEGLDDADFKAELREDAGREPDFPIGGFESAAESVRDSIGRIKDSSFVPETGKIRGFVYDVDSGKLEEVGA